MYFDWITWSIWLLGLIILIIWVYVPYKEFKKHPLYKFFNYQYLISNFLITHNQYLTLIPSPYFPH